MTIATELVALLSVAHSTGSSYLNLRFLEGVPSTSWRNSQAIFDYCSYLTNNVLIFAKDLSCHYHFEMIHLLYLIYIHEI